MIQRCFHYQLDWSRMIVLLCVATSPALLSISTTDAAVVVSPMLTVDHVATGLSANFRVLTTGVVAVDADTFLAVERKFGRVVRIDLEKGNTVLPSVEIFDLDVINCGDDEQSEYGVQSIIRHPNFHINGWVYIRYDRSPTPGIDTPQTAVIFGPDFTASTPTQNVIERYVWDPEGNKGSGSLTFDCQIASVTIDTRYHHGGGMAFGNDEKLFAAYGDLRHWVPSWVPGHSGMFLSTNVAGGQIGWPSTIVRLNDDGTIPIDNPFGNGGSFDAWYGYGVRNCFALAVDPVTGHLWNTDNGESNFDEINRIPPGFNGGHKWVTGPIDHPQQTGTINDLNVIAGSHYVDPQFSWWVCMGVTGLHFLHGSALGNDFDDVMLAGTYNSAQVWGFHLNPARTAFALTAPELQGQVNESANPSENPIGTPMEEVFFGDGFGTFFAGNLSIVRGLEPGGGLPYVLTGTGDLYRIRRIVPLNPVDLNEDGLVGVPDLLMVINAWGACPPPCAEDIAPPPNGDRSVGVPDLLMIINNWGE